MGTSVNKVILVGNIGNDPELKYTPNGTPFLHLSLATNETWTDQTGNKQQRVEWHNLELWNRSAENCAQYLHKGSQIYVEGSLKYQKYNDKQGMTRLATKVAVQRVQFLDKKPQESGPDFDWATGE